ncbi:MAG: hypothetical protein ACKO4R_07645, partial [Synechococcales cyanobacterium]
FNTGDNGTYTITGLQNPGNNHTFQWGGTNSQIRVNVNGINFSTNAKAFSLNAASSGVGYVNASAGITSSEFSGIDGTITTSSLEPATPVPLQSDALPVLTSAVY